MTKMFSGQVAIVTGGSDGIGRATAQILAQRGAHVVICARRTEKLTETQALIEDAGGSVETVQLDVSDTDAFETCIRTVAKDHGRLDMLVNNAASTQYAPIKKLSLENWRKDFSVNTEAVFIGTKTAMEIMTAQGHGSIVNVSSSCALRAARNLSSYSASKAALTHFTACAAMECAADGVRVNAVVPGQVQTQANEDFAKKAPEIAARTAAAIPMKRGGQPSELAEVICFLLSDGASYITGAALPVDGGKIAELHLPG
jgi:NAD(P)-dependent dehydrogenase (short-subunit alcohol dehydrogenase family)